MEVSADARWVTAGVMLCPCNNVEDILLGTRSRQRPPVLLAAESIRAALERTAGGGCPHINAAVLR